LTDSTPEAWRLLFGDPEKATSINEVAKQMKVSVPKVEDAPVAKAAESESEEVVKEKKDKKEKKEKKDKKDKKAKKAKKADSDSD
jgi:hypothetical protein